MCVPGNPLVNALKDLQKEHGNELGDEDFQLLYAMLQTSEFQGAMEVLYWMYNKEHHEPSML